MALTDNIVSYWKLDESSGNATDSVGGNTLTNTNTVTYGTALINNGADFGTSNTNKKLSTSTGYQTGSFSISGWFKLKTEIASGQYGIFQMSDNTTSLRSILLTYDYNSGTRRVTADYHKNNTSDNNVIYSSGAIGTSVWTHFVVTYNGTTFTLYINGSSVGTPLTISGGGSGSVGTQGITFGLADRFSGSYASVLLDEVGLWSRALSGSEITTLYNSGVGLQYPFGTAYSLALATGSYVYTGFNTLFNIALKISIAVGTFTYTGINTLLKVAYGMVINVGSYVYTGFSTSLLSSNIWANITKSITSWTQANKNTTAWSDDSKSNTTWTDAPKS